MTLFDLPTWQITTALLCLMLIANEIGFRVGRKNQRSETDVSRTVSNALKGSVFALVALLLAFSFSATTSRYDLRHRLVLDQANAIGTCYLRAGLLEETARNEIQNALRQYITARLDLTNTNSPELITKIDNLLNQLWKAVESANNANPERVRNSMIVPAANEVIDLNSTRAWANRNHLPNPVLFLLLASLVISCFLLGHSSGQAGVRHVGLWIASNVILTLVMFVILDFDRPRRGLIQVDQTPLVELRDTIQES